VYATLLGVFPEVETWYTKQDDLLLVSTAKPIVYDAARLSERLRQEPIATAMEVVWRVAGLEGFLSHYLARASFGRTFAAETGATKNSDDRNVVEFGFARSVGRHSSFDVSEMRRLSRSRGEDKPGVSGNVDWMAVDRWRVTAATSDGAMPAAVPGLATEALRQVLAQKSFLEGEPEVVLANWRDRPWEVVGSVEEFVLAEALAQGGEERAAALIERLRGFHPVEAELLIGRLRWRQGRLEEAVGAFERAFVAYRRDPWPLLQAVRNAFPIVADIASKDTRLAVRLWDVLAQPFAAALLEDERRLVRLEVASRADAARYAEAVQEMEPNVPWRRRVLELRARAYEATGNTRAALARRELEEFIEKEPRSRRN
jgi:spermidine synthase